MNFDVRYVVVASRAVSFFVLELQNDIDIYSECTVPSGQHGVNVGYRILDWICNALNTSSTKSNPTSKATKARLFSFPMTHHTTYNVYYLTWVKRDLNFKTFACMYSISIQ